MEYLNPFNEPIDPDSDYFTMPTRVILDPQEDETAVLESLDKRYARLIDEWAHQELESYQSRETRYEHDHEQPTFPIVVRTIQRSTRPRPEVVLPDGRRAILLDGQRVQIQCGIQEILLLRDLQQIRRKPIGGRHCPSCGGKHLADRPASSARESHARRIIPCKKCQSNLASSSYWDGPDTLVCLHCGTRVARPLSQLSHEEEAANDSAIAQLLAINDMAVTPETTDDDDDADADLDLEQVEDNDSDTLTQSEDDAEILSPFDDHYTVDHAPETTPLDVTELLEIQALLDTPSERWNAERHSIVIQQLLAITNTRLDNPQDDELFQEVFRRVVAEEVGHLGDLLHDPACQLFKASCSPLRQELLDRAIQQHDTPDTRMAIWAAVGRLLNDTNVQWLKDYRAAARDARIPSDRKARAQFWKSLQQAKKHEVEPIIDWFLSLSKEDLAILAGDPESSHPFVHHPDPEVFQSTDTLLAPLIRFFANELQRFRQKQTGCTLLASDYGIAEESLRQIAIQSGQLPGPPAPPTQAVA
ncbi:MAG: hypothetical protein KGS09_19925 [Nitrospirae bacterium]|nr:hypothetical protein [Nitrospirota bacterium]MDE3041637.1 hypothetical protein [Nitrospirota bacterium]